MYIVSGLPSNITINLPESWAVDTDERAVTVNDAYKVSSLADEFGVRIAGSCSITVNFSGITFTARRTHSVTRWEESGNELIVEYAGNTYTFTKENKDGDEYFVVDGLPNGAVINLPAGWIVDTDGRGITVNDPSKVSALDEEYAVNISGPCTITVNYPGITFTARLVNQTPDSTKSPAFKSANLILSGQIGVNFFLDLPEIQGVDYYNGKSCYMAFDIKGNKTSNNPQPTDGTLKMGDYFGYRCYINSVQMADPITADFHYGNDKTVSYVYTIKRYLDNKINGSSDENMRKLAASIKDYGHYAQLYLSRVNNWVLGVKHIALDAANEYTDSDIEEVRQIAGQYAPIRDEYAGTGIASVQYSLELAAETTINLIFKMESGYSGSVFASLNGGRENMAVRQSDGTYQVQIASISAHRLADTQTVKITATKDFSIKVSALTFVYTSLKGANMPEDRQKLGVALYRYYTSAIDYRKANQ